MAQREGVGRRSSDGNIFQHQKIQLEMEQRMGNIEKALGVIENNQEIMMENIKEMKSDSKEGIEKHEKVREEIYKSIRNEVKRRDDKIEKLDAEFEARVNKVMLVAETNAKSIVKWKAQIKIIGWILGLLNIGAILSTLIHLLKGA